MTAVAEEVGARCLRVEHCMGTVFTIDIRDPGCWDNAVTQAVNWLHHVDAVFSTYNAASDISQLRRGRLALASADPDVRRVLDLCEQVEAETGGCFTMFRGPALDPTGLVKGWAIEQASRLLRAHGSDNHAVNGGGDMQLAGEPEPGRPWTVGISDPNNPARLITSATSASRDFAVATSGIAERGQHIVDPRTGDPAVDLASVTVTGRSLTRVDAYATAAFVMGRDGLAWVENQPGFEAFFVFPDGATAATSGFTG